MKNRRKAVQPFEIKKRKIDIFRNYEANGFEKNQRKFENFSTLISKKSTLKSNFYGKQVRPLLRISMKSSSVQKTSFFSLLLALLVNRRLFSRLWDKWTKRQELLLSCLAISAEITLLLPPQTSVTCMP